MTKFNTSIFSALLLVSAIVLASCGSDDDEPVVIPERPQNVEARFTDTIRYEKEKTTAYNFEYPSTDPYGEPVTLSGTITIGDEVRSTQHARGLLLYNHYTVYRADQCPSKGELGAQLFMTVADSSPSRPTIMASGPPRTSSRPIASPAPTPKPASMP